MKAFISYLEDHDQKREAFVDIIELNQSFVKFSTDKNIIILPISRVLKIKETRNEHDTITKQ